MKKQITLFAILISFSTFLFAQNVPNGGFENWSSGDPVDWTTSNDGSTTTVFQDNDSYSGSSAVRLQTDSEETKVPEIESGYDNFGIPVSQRYEELSFYYKYIEDGSDKLVIQISIADEDYQTLGSAVFEIEDNEENYTQALVPIEYDEPGTPAFAIITITLLDGFGSGPPSEETYALIDDVEFTGSQGVDEINTESTRILISPQPANDVARISFNSDVKVNNLNLSIIDPSGRSMGEYKFGNISSGMNEVMVDVSHFTPGLYIVLINADGESFTKKMIVK